MRDKKKLRWDEIVDRAEKSVFRVYAGSSAGTGVIISLGSDPRTSESYVSIATAWHVISDLQGSSEDIRIVSADKTTELSSDTTEMGFYPMGIEKYDTGIIVIKTDSIGVGEKDLVPLPPADSMLARGADIGWLGFPGITEPELCFFHGYISGYKVDPPLYFVDGVAIHGVSGGPAFDERGNLVGLVSAYIPNQIDQRTTLPGLMALTPSNAIRYWFEHRLGAEVRKQSPRFKF